MKREKVHAEAQRRRGGGREGTAKSSSPPALSAALRLCVGICLLLSFTAGAAAQVPDPPDNFVTEDNSTGVAAFTSYAGHRENINLNNLNLNIVIPLIALRGRNGLNVEVVAHYNSVQREWVEREMGPLGELTCDLEGISEAGAEEFYIQLEPRLTYEEGELSSTTPFPRRHRYVLREADGTRHELRLRDNDAEEYNQNNWVLAGRFRSTGSSHLSLQESLQPDGRYDAAVYLPDGRQIGFEPLFQGRGNQQAQYIRDSNGNQVTFEWSAGQAVKLVDTLGREVRRSFDAPSKTTTIEVDTASGQVLTWVLTETELTLPSGLSYRFEWDFEGPYTDPCEASQSRTDKRLVRIYYPAGGSTRYEWTVPALPNNTKTLLHKRHTCDRTDGLACLASEEHTFTYLRDFPGGFTQVTRPDGTFSRHHFVPFAELNGEEKEIRTERYTVGGVLLRSVEQDWDIYGRDPKVAEVREKRHDTGGAALVKRRVMTYDEDGYARPRRDLSTGNLVRLEEYAWGQGTAGPLLRRTENDYLVTPSYGIESSVHILDRLTQTQVFDGSGELGSQSDFFYDEYTTLSGFSRSLIGVSAIQRASAFGTGYTTRGNLSRRVDWLNDGPDPVTLLRYDTAGNLRQLRDPNGNVGITGYSSSTEFAYPSSTTNPLGHVESFQYDYNATFDRGWGRLTARTDANGRTTTMAYDMLGRVKRIDFPDGGVEHRYYSDLEAAATHHQSGALVFPEQTQLPLRTKTYTRITTTPFLEQEGFEVADGLARLSLSGLRNGSDMDWAGTAYDGNGRVSQSSNPLSVSYGSGAVPAISFSSWTTTSYDALDRVTEIETPDGQSAVTGYAGNQTTVTDQVGAARRSTADALGRIVAVREPDPSTGSLDSGGFSDTLYSYDVLDNLTAVQQGLGGSDQDGAGGDGVTQSRSFLYDSLSRLVQESHPESGTARYGYDANGNLVETVDARSRRTDNDYDSLNRILSTSYSVEGDPSRSDPTPPVSYLYDGSTSLNRRGRLRSVTDGAGTSTFEYDPMGRISRSVRTTQGKTLSADYAYTLLGGVKTATYQGISAPSFSLSYGYDSQGRQASLSDGFNTYVSSYGFDYQAQGAIERTFYGNGIQERIDYNNRLQPVGRSVLNPSSQLLMDLGYSFIDPANSGNNGNIYRIDDQLAGQGRSFSYDKLNRLAGVGGPGAAWSIAYSYDRFGNRLSALGSSSPPNFQDSLLTVDPSTNRITSAGWEHDSAGNVIEDGGAHHLRWDSAGRLIEMGPPQPSGSGPPGDDGRCTGPGCPPPPPPPPDPDPPLDDGRTSGGLKAQSAATVAYEYDYQDRRVVKDEGTTGRIYFWDEVLGEVIWEFPLENPSSQDLLRFFLNGRLVAENDARPGGGFHYFHRDHLGTSKLMTDFFSPVVVCDEVYHPFGQVQSELPSSCNGHVRKFTGKERDQESGLDYFGARYCDSVAGRFMSVDPALYSANKLDPQTWNRFSYTSNSPMNRIDPDGRRWFVKDGEDPVWVEPDEDGSFTAPGDGWVPIEGQLIITRGSTVFFFNADDPRVYSDGALEDDTDSLILAGQLAKGAGQLFRGLAKRGGGGGARPHSGFSGRKGSELKNAAYQKTRNQATTIGERRFSGHALDQMQNRGIPPSVVENTIKTGKTYPTGAGTKGFYDPINDIRVIISSSDGGVVTVIRGAPK